MSIFIPNELKIWLDRVVNILEENESTLFQLKIKNGVSELDIDENIFHNKKNIKIKLLINKITTNLTYSGYVNLVIENKEKNISKNFLFFSNNKYFNYKGSCIKLDSYIKIGEKKKIIFSFMNEENEIITDFDGVIDITIEKQN